MKKLSETISNTPKSKIRKLFDLAAGKSDIISLGIGQPDTPSPQSLIDGTIEALKNRKTVYAPTRGIPELLKTIEKKAKVENNINAEWKKNIIITNGGSQSITLAMATLLNPKDEILLSSPNFLSYFYCSRFFYSIPVEVQRYENFSPNFDLMRKKITPKTKAIIINSPNNPTGYTYSRKDWEELANIVIDNDLFLISDEVYEKYVYDDNKPFSPASMNGMENRTVTLNAISKTFSATGFRLGYVIANEEIITLMEKYLQYTAAGVNHPTQFGAVAAYTSNDSNFDELRKLFKERRDLVYTRLNKMGLKVEKPGGSFYIMPSIKDLNISADDFALKLMEEKGVAVVPGDGFGSYSSDMIRISYAIQIEKLEQAMNKIEEFISSL